MNLRKINESFTSLYGNDKYLKESVDYDSLEYKLNQAVEDTMKGENRSNIKYYEDALQKAIEDMYPDKAWWEITDLNIFWHLFENKDPYLTVKAIIDNLKPEYRNECLTESIDEDKIDNLLSNKKEKVKYGPNRYVYAICKQLGYEPPMFLDPASGGVRLRYSFENEQEANKTKNEIENAAKELGIDLIKSYVKPRFGKYDTFIVVPRYNKSLDEDVDNQNFSDYLYGYEDEEDAEWARKHILNIKIAPGNDSRTGGEGYYFIYPERNSPLFKPNRIWDEIDVSKEGATHFTSQAEAYEWIQDNIVNGLGINVNVITESLNEDTVKLKSGKWTNKGDTGKTHGTFKTKKAADAQRKAMFAQGYKAEGIEETKEEELLVEKSGKNTLKAEFDKILNSLGESELKEGKTIKGLSLKQEFDNILDSIKNESIEESMELPIDKPMSKLKGTLSNIMAKHQKELAGISNIKEAIEFLDKIEPQVKNKHYLNSIKLQLQKTPDYKAQTFLYNIILKGDGMRSF